MLPDASTSPARFRPLAGHFLLFLLAMVLLFPGTGDMPLMDRDEPKFARATVEMMERSDWVVPWFNGSYRFDKPPLVYWWMQVHYRIFGVSEAAARLHSVLASAFSAMVVFSLGRWMYGARAGWMAGAAWLASMQVMVHLGRLCVADMPMILAVCLTALSLARLLLPEEKPSPYGRWWWLLLLSLVLGFLAKGPVAQAVPLVGLLLTRWCFGRHHRWDWSRLHWPLLLVLFLAGIALWGVPALLRTGGKFWDVGMGEHVWERGTRSFNGRIPLPGIYFLTVFLSLLPWSGHLPAALARDGMPRSRASAFLLGWLLAPFLIFTFYSTMLPHYVAPGLPAFFLLLFRGDKLPAPGTPFRHRFAMAVVGLPAVVAIALLALRQGIPADAAASGLRSVLLAASGIFTLATAATWFSARGNFRAALVSMLLASAVMVVLGKEVRKLNPGVAIAGELATVPGNPRFLATGFIEPSLVYYTNQEWKFRGDTARWPEAVAWLGGGTKAEPRAVVILAREWTLAGALRHVMAGGNPAFVPPDRSPVPDDTPWPAGFRARRISGYNNGRSSWCEVIVLSPIATNSPAR